MSAKNYGQLQIAFKYDCNMVFVISKYHHYFLFFFIIFTIFIQLSILFIIFFLLSILLVDLLVFCYEIPLSLVLPKLLFSYYHLLTTCLYENWSELKLVVNFKPLNLKLFFSHVCLTNFAWKNFKSQLAMWVSFNWCN